MFYKVNNTSLIYIYIYISHMQETFLRNKLYYFIEHCINADLTEHFLPIKYCYIVVACIGLVV